MKRSVSVVHSVTSSWVLLGATTVSQLVQVPIALHYLDKQEFGLFALLSQFINTLMLLELGVTSALTRLFVDGHAQGRDAFNRIWSSASASSAPGRRHRHRGAGGDALSLPRLQNTGDLAHTATWLFLAIGGYGVARYVLNIFGMALVAGQRMATSNMISLVNVVLQLVIFVAALHFGVGIWAYVIANLVTLPVAQFLNWRAGKRHGLLGEFRREHVRRRELGKFSTSAWMSSSAAVSTCL